MKLINQSLEIIPQEEGFEGIYKNIEIAGRTCYKSENKITKDSAKDFTQRMINSGHLAMLEFGTVYLKFPISGIMNQIQDHTYMDYVHNKYSKTKDILSFSNPNNTIPMRYCYITTNYRVLIENHWEDDLKYMCEPTKYHYKRVHVKFTTNRQIANEFVRHRVFSFAQESTRYCNYSKDKFGSMITFIKPWWYDTGKDTLSDRFFIEELKAIESEYGNLTVGKLGSAQAAAQILPLCTKTELNMCGFISDWKHFFELRDSSNAHPQAQELAHKLKEKFIQMKLIEE
jgi:thymidylate synthase (FAD)